MRLKSDKVNVIGVHQDCWYYLFRLDEVWRDIVGHELIITSARDGKHSMHSDHYWGGGFDLRTWTTKDSGIQLTGLKRQTLLSAVRTALGKNWYVEDERDHFHISYRPVTPTILGEYANV